MKDEMEVVLRYSQDVPIDIFGLIEELGIVYLEQPMGAGLSGRIDYNEPFCTITVSSEESYQRRRFTAAHELGHYLLHRDLMDGKQHLDRLFANGGRDNPVAPLSPLHEVQANRFAADLLMPINALRDRYDPIRDNVAELAGLFEVSQAAMKIRLKAIGVRPQG